MYVHAATEENDVFNRFWFSLVELKGQDSYFSVCFPRFAIATMEANPLLQSTSATRNLAQHFKLVSAFSFF